MTQVFLVIVAIAGGGLDKLPMESYDTCRAAAKIFNAPTQDRVAVAYCISAAAPHQKD
jgi:hypothetical protein